MGHEHSQIITTDGEDVALMAPENPTSGDTAADVFTCLDDGMSPTAIVIDLALPVSRVEALWQTWARLRGHLLLPADAVAAVDAALPSYVPLLPPVTASAIVERAKALSDGKPRVCLRCEAEPAQYCAGCAEAAARNASAVTSGAGRKTTRTRGSKSR